MARAFLIPRLCVSGFLFCVVACPPWVFSHTSAASPAVLEIPRAPRTSRISRLPFCRRTRPPSLVRGVFPRVSDLFLSRVSFGTLLSVACSAPVSVCIQPTSCCLREKRESTRRNKRRAERMKCSACSWEGKRGCHTERRPRLLCLRVFRGVYTPEGVARTPASRCIFYLFLWRGVRAHLIVYRGSVQLPRRLIPRSRPSPLSPESTRDRYASPRCRAPAVARAVGGQSCCECAGDGGRVVLMRCGEPLRPELSKTTFDVSGV